MTTTPLRLGFLIEPLAFAFENARLEPVANHAEQRVLFAKQCNKDGFFYPPQTAMYRIRADGTRGRRLTRTIRPAQAFHLPASHTLSVKAPIAPAVPYSDSTFLLQAVAFISGTRLQFEPWRIDGRVPSQSTLGASIPANVHGHFVERAYDWWRALPNEHRIRSINLFHAYNRAASAEWDWDMFTQQYIVFDGLYRLHAEIIGMKKDVGHRKRFDLLTTAYDVPTDTKIVDLLYKARNDLFHEAIWAGSMMGYAPAAPDSVQYPRHLRRLNSRLLCAITGYRNTFTRSVWWAMGSFNFSRAV